MSSRKLLALTGVVIALFACIFFFERKMPTTSEREQKGDLYWDVPADRVESIRLEHGQGIGSRVRARGLEEASRRIAGGGESRGLRAHEAVGKSDVRVE